MVGRINPDLGTHSFNPFAAGRKQYGASASFSPTMGQVDRTGYIDRENRNKARINAMKAWMRDRQQGKNASSNVLRFGKGTPR